jgi:hypothetical protein
MSASAMRLLVLLVPTVSSLRRQSRTNITRSSEVPWPIGGSYSDFIESSCGGCITGLPCHKKTCEGYCNYRMTEPCTWRRAKCHGSGFAARGHCECGGCPGRERTAEELWQQNCGGKCGSGEYCYFDGRTFVDGVMSERVSDFRFSGITPRCTSCLLTYDGRGIQCDGRYIPLGDDLFRGWGAPIKDPPYPRRQERWQQNCGGKCGSGEHCYFGGWTFVDGIESEYIRGEINGSLSSSRPRCSSCLLTHDEDEYVSRCI